MKFDNSTGVNNRNARLTPEIVRDIRAMNEAGVRQTEIARKHGISASQVSAIICGRRWRSVK